MSMNLTKLTNAEYPLSDAREAIDGDNALDPSDPSAYYTAAAIRRAIGSAREPNSSEARSAPPHPAKPSGSSSTNGATHPTANTSETSN